MPVTSLLETPERTHTLMAHTLLKLVCEQEGYVTVITWYALLLAYAAAALLLFRGSKHAKKRVVSSCLS